MNPTERPVTEIEAADRLGLSVKTLRAWRCRDKVRSSCASVGVDVEVKGKAAIIGLRGTLCKCLEGDGLNGGWRPGHGNVSHSGEK